MCRIVFGSMETAFFSAKEAREATRPMTIKNSTMEIMMNPSIDANMNLKKSFIIIYF
jgi:hypothetical protein